MSRGRYVYVVRRADGGLLAAFTVKYELATWLEHYKPSGPAIVSRIEDGGNAPWAQPISLNPQTLEPEK